MAHPVMVGPSGMPTSREDAILCGALCWQVKARMSHPEKKLEELSEQVLSIARAKATGTLKVTGSDDYTKQFFFNQGYLADLDTGREDTVLEAALLSTELFSEKDQKRARKAAAKADTPVGAALLELNIVPEDDISELLQKRLPDEFCESFEWEIETVEFFEHKVDERLETFFSELSDLFEVLVDPEEVFLEAARRSDRWDLVTTNFSMLCDVVYATPSSFRYFREQDQYPYEHAIVSMADGTKDVEEVITESGIDPFEALIVLRSLHGRGELELINPVQMFQLGVECVEAARFEKAARLFRRAHERGLDDFDVQLKLAQTLDSLGRIDEAISRYLEFCDKCLSQFRADDAIRSLRRVIKLNPDLLEAQEKHLEVLLSQHRGVEALDQGMDLAEKSAQRGDPRAALDVLLRVRDLNPRDVKLQQKVIELAETCGEHEMARSEREVLAKDCDERKDAELALEIYQKMFCDGNNSLEVRLKLVDLHAARGNRQKVLDHISSILNLPEKKRVKEPERLLKLHKTVCELKPNDIRSNRWLADYYSKNGQRDEAAQALISWIGYLESDGDLEEVAHAYEKLITLNDFPEHRWGLAKTLEKLGRLSECRRELRSLANLELRKKEFEQASNALDYILKTAPLDVETRKMQADLYEAQENLQLAAKVHEEIALLSMLSGNIQEAEQYCRRLGPDRPTVAEAVRKLGELCLEQGDRQKAIEQLLKAAKMHLEQENYGLYRTSLDELLAVEPGHLEGKALLAELQEKETRRAAPPPESAAESPEQGPATPTSASKPESESAPALAPAPDATVPESAKPAPAPVPRAEPHVTTGRVVREPFQHARPVKTSVSGIMARLKMLKSGGGNGPTKIVRSGGGSMDSVNESNPEAATGAEASKDKDVAVQPANKALKSAAARLKALAGKKAEATTAENAGAAPEPSAAEGAAPQPSAPPETVKKMKLGPSASKLAQLRKATPTG